MKEKISKNKWYILAVIAVIGIIGNLNQPAKPIKQYDINGTITKTQPTPTPKYDTFKNIYMKSCIKSSDGLESYCDCTYEYLLNKLGKDGFTKLSMDYVKTEIVPDDMYEAIEKCTDEIK